MKSRILTALASLFPLLAPACGADQGEWVETETAESGGELAEASEAVAACAGDDLQYDFNAFAASLAVAAANELGRWEAITDFEVRNGKLELSATGELHCNGGCNNIRAILRLQDDASASVPNHSPSVFRSKLTGWHARQKTELTNLVNKMLTMDKGVYRFKNKQTGKYLQVDGGTSWDGAWIEQRSTPPQPGADQWRVVLDHTAHKLINVRSGKCMALGRDAIDNNINLIQQTCSSSALQKFGFATIGSSHYSVRTKWGQALRVKDASPGDDVPVVQYLFSGTDASQQWSLESVGNTISPDVVANAMYTLTAKHSGKAVAVDGGSLNDNAWAEQSTYSSTDDRFQWFIVRMGGGDRLYNFVNRRSGKCLDLQSASASGRLLQRTCSSASTQLFTLISAGDGTHVLYSVYGKAIEVEGNSTSNDALLAQSGDETWAANRQFTLTPVLAGEPHRLTFSHASDDGPCGDYYWYNIKQASGQPLGAPANSFVQLIFAGGKTTAGGKDENPFIAQQVQGNLVAIDPSGHMNGGSTGTSGSCIESDILYSSTSAVLDRCCIRYNGTSGKLKKSSWSTMTYLCQ